MNVYLSGGSNRTFMELKLRISLEIKIARQF